MTETTIHITDTDVFLTEGKATWLLPVKLPSGGIGQAAARARRGQLPVAGAEAAKLPKDAAPALQVIKETIVIVGPIRPSLERLYRFAGWSPRTMLATRADAELLVSVNQVADRIGVSYQRAYAWLVMSRTAPEPVDPESKRPQWRWSEVRAHLLGPEGPTSKLIDRWREEERVAEVEAAAHG